MRNRIYLFIIAVFGLSCTEEPENPSVSFRWIPSEFSKYGSANFQLLRAGDDNKLYALGYVDGIYGVHNATTNGWEKVMELSFTTGEWFQEFAWFKKNLYLLKRTNNSGTLWKTNGTSMEQVSPYDAITGISHLDSKLVVAGSFTNGSNHTYGLAHSTDGHTFTLVGPSAEDLAPPGYINFKADDKIFLTGSDGFNYAYDGSEAKKIDYPQYQKLDAIDAKGIFYRITSSSIDGSLRQEIEKFEKGIASRVGNIFDKNIRIFQILLKDEKIIATGDNPDNGLSAVYFLDKNEWRPVPTTNYFTRAFVYGERVMAFTPDGVVAELVYGQEATP